MRRLTLVLCGALLGFTLLAVLERMLALVDPEQSAICRRIIPALHPGAPLVIEAIGRGEQQRDVIVRYSFEQAGQSVPARITCRFGGSGIDASRRELVALRGPEGEISGSTLYFLRRFWLGSADALAHDPGAPPPWQAIQVPFAFAYAAQHLFAALPSAAVYALIACSYALVYGLIGRVLIGFGEVAALGSIVGVISITTWIDHDLATPVMAIAVAVICAALAGALHGYAAGQAVLDRLRRGPGQPLLIATVGLSIALSEYLRLMQGNETRWLPPVAGTPLPVLAAGRFVASLSPVVIAMTLAGLGACLGVVWWLTASQFGRDWRAMADDPVMAQLMGIDAGAVFNRAIMTACAMSVLAGMIITVIFGGMGYAGGLAIGLKGLVAAVLGGIGSVRGAALCGLAIAIIEALWSATLPIEQRDLVVYALLAVVLIIRPGGFFGEAQITPRPV